MYNVLPMTSDGEGHGLFNLGGNQFELVTRYNYSAECWLLDILDSDGAALLNGLMMVPDVDMLKPHPAVKALIGALVTIELNPGDYRSPFFLGTNVQLIWYPVGTAVVLP